MICRRRLAALGWLVAVVAEAGSACTASGSPTGAPGSRPAHPVGPLSAPAGGADRGGPSCPARYPQPDPRRPDVRLTFDLAADLTTVTGTEQVTFTPDLPVRDVQFRLTANTPTSVAAGNSINVSAATADPAGGPFRVDQIGAAAGTQGGMLVVPLAGESAAGTTVRASVRFTLRLGAGSFDRFGRAAGFAWWGSGEPLLAWERGVGWHREPLAQIIGESATSEAFRIDVAVSAPAGLAVLTGGVADPAADVGGGRRRWHAVADRARDLSVAVGPFRIATATVAGTRLVVGTPPDRDPGLLLGEHRRAIVELSRRLGPFPFPALTVARLPLLGGGIEYPGSILMLDDSPLVAVHETAHQWFYAMIGDSQARHPWLDEAFATFAEQLVNNDAGNPTGLLAFPGRVDGSMQDFGTSGDYFSVVYNKGSAALQAARRAAGPDRFDAALRCFVAANAWRIVHPADVARALAGLPAAVAVLRAAGAVP